VYLLNRLLYCACGQACHPIERPDRSRAYGSVCGCRLLPVDAATVERMVLDLAEREVPAMLAGVSRHCQGAVLSHIFARVYMGGRVDDLTPMPRRTR
jgi:hypothetical protein